MRANDIVPAFFSIIFYIAGIMSFLKADMFLKIASFLVSACIIFYLFFKNAINDDNKSECYKYSLLLSIIGTPIICLIITIFVSLFYGSPYSTSEYKKPVSSYAYKDGAGRKYSHSGSNYNSSSSKIGNTSNRNGYSVSDKPFAGFDSNKSTVSAVTESGGIIIGTDVFMRSGPGTQYKPVGVFKQGETVEIVERQQDWFKVRSINHNSNVWVFKRYCAEYFGNRQMPNKIILHQAYPGEVTVNILNYMVSPKRNLNVYEKNDENSKIIGTLNVGNYYSIFDFELHTYPRNNVYTTNSGATIRLLSYRGEGYYSIFRNGIIQEVEMQTNQLVLKQEPDFWLCIKTSEGRIGWVFVKEFKDFLTEKGSGIFLTNISLESEAISFFKSYHRAITNKDYSSAYNCLSSDMKRSLGNYDTYCNGYVNTIYSSVTRTSVLSVTGNTVEVEYDLQAKDYNNSGGTIIQKFAGVVLLQKNGGVWKIIDNHARKA